MLGSKGDVSVFWSNPLVGSITTLALVLLVWPVISRFFDKRRVQSGGEPRVDGTYSDLR
jgi:putative tricarboxylic transport membrane protein